MQCKWSRYYSAKLICHAKYVFYFCQRCQGTILSFFVLQTPVNSPTHIHPNQVGTNGVTLQGNCTLFFSWSARIVFFWHDISRPCLMTLLMLVMQSFQSYDLRGKNHAMFKEDNTVSSLSVLSSVR